MDILEHFPGHFISISQDHHIFTISTSTDCMLQVTLVSDDIARIRFATEGIFENDFSYAIDEKNNLNPSHFSFNILDEFVEIASRNFKVVIRKEDLKISFVENSGRIICRDDKGFHWQQNETFGGNIVKNCKVIQEGEHFYGLGDKTMHPNLRGRKLTNWAMDIYGFKKNEDPIYKAIPFYLGIHHDVGYGIFFDNTFKSFFDFGSERKTVTSFWAEGGEMNYYFIYGPKLLQVIQRYTSLTGRPELPPMWALGFHQSKWSYYPEQKVRDITQKLRKLQIPCDAIYFDIDYMDGFRCFTWDKGKFPNPKKFVAELKAQGFKSIVIIDPGIKKDKTYDIYNQALANDYFCKRADGPYVSGKVWPGDCYFPDFTDPKVRKWWGGLHQELIEDTGVRGVWNDMNEPAVLETETKTFPLDARHDYDGNPCSHRKAHNIYGTQMARATYRGLKRIKKEYRPFVITRSAYAGAQRYASTWTGDNIASWEHLWLANVQIQRLNVTGFVFAGTDIGGFIDHPTPDLFIRWVQMAVFHPFCRIHSSGDHGEQEPWSFGEDALQIVRRFIELRYTLLPYLYTAFYKHVTEGTPVIQPIAVFDQFDKETLYRADEFLFGEDILVCPVLEPNAPSRYVYLPEGKWYHYFTYDVFEGKKEVVIPTPLDTLPLFVRAGSVIPHFPVMQYVGEKEVDVLTLYVYFGQGIHQSIMYEDAGDGYAYESGDYNKKTWITHSLLDSFELTLESRGHYQPTYKHYKIVLFGLPFNPTRIQINEKDIHPGIMVENQMKYELVIESKLFLQLKIQ
ncbi:MAG: glycoside hydrolase family 31 protein [Saprospiraceae bacterium]|nr:glycoside hydrolase family 31 protein [Saprospiraceae bacterium]